MRLAENTGRKKVAKNRHLSTIAQLCRAISLQLRHVSTIRKNLLSSNMSHMSPQYGELRPTSGWDRFTSLGYPCKFPPVLRLGRITARHLVVGVSQTLRRWTEGATYIRQGDHHVRHWPKLLVFGYIVEHTNTKIPSSHFFAISILNPNYDVISGFAKVVVERCGFYHWIAQRISWGEVVSVFLSYSFRVMTSSMTS